MNKLTTIKQEDFIQSIADALQYISYYHPADYIHALGEASKQEESPAAKDAIAQILTNSRMCAEGKRPLCLRFVRCQPSAAERSNASNNRWAGV